MDYELNYPKIAMLLGLSADADKEAAKILDALIPDHDAQDDLCRLENSIKNKKAIVYGAGPSLGRDVQMIKKIGLHNARGTVHIAADGAVKALLENGILPDIQVTDLDGFPQATMDANRQGTITVVHAHGDNVSRLKEFVPRLKDVIGTTQTEPFGKLHNFGGFSDGDRCVFLADGFGPELIVLAGMDFGPVIGEYSGRSDREKKIKKLAVGKRLVEQYAKESSAIILNLTTRGEEIRNVPRVSAADLRVFSFGNE